MSHGVMKMKAGVLAYGIMLILTLVPSGVHAGDLEDLARQGYAVIEETQVDGEFEGCEYGKQIQLMNGLIFVCETYNYSYSYMPDVLILKHLRAGDIRVIIDGQEYDGTLYRRR
jgi:hypothetical protein